MPSSIIRPTTILIVSLFLFACGGGGSDSGGEPAPADPIAIKSVVAIGDSIGTGFGIATPWPELLGGAISRTVINNSISGEQTGFGVANIERLINDNDPSHVFILLGTNDAIRGSVPNALNNLQTMVDFARSRNVIPIVGTLPPITRSNSENRRADEISRGIRRLNNAVVAEVRGALGSGATIADGVHPNQSGQQIITDTFASVF